MSAPVTLLLFTFGLLAYSGGRAYKLQASVPTETTAANVYDCSPGNTCPIDLKLARTFLNFSNIAYCPSTSVSNWTCPSCIDTAEDFTPTWLAQSTYKLAGYYGVSHTRQAIVVAFRGSTNYRNWLANLDTITTAYPWATGARVHRGFYSAYVDSFKDAMASGVTQLHAQYPEYKIYITGHSLGAALAVLCAADLKTVSKLPIAALYTFGGPRVGNRVFSTWFQENILAEIFRFTHRHDIVPHVPMFGTHVMTFHHVAREYWQPSVDPDIISVCDGSGEDQWCADSVRLALSVEDHLNYLGVRIGSRMCVGPNTDMSDPELLELLADEQQNEFDG